MLDIRNYIDRQIEAFGAYESDQLSFLFEQMDIHKSEYFFDIGANWGLYSIQIALDSRFKDLMIFAFEPDTVNRHQLFSNLFINSLSNSVVVSHFAVSDRNGYEKFENYGSENRGRSHISKNGSNIVEVNFLDALFNFKSK